MVILDTDHLTIIQRRSEPAYSYLVSRLRELSSRETCATIVSFEEQMRGWLAVISRAKRVGQEITAYRHLHALFAFFSAIPVLEFDEVAAQRYLQLRRSRLRPGAMDLKIASLALAHEAVLLSRNLVDFARVPGLQVEDWTRS